MGSATAKAIMAMFYKTDLFIMGLVFGLQLRTVLECAVMQFNTHPTD